MDNYGQPIAQQPTQQGYSQEPTQYQQPVQPQQGYDSIPQGGLLDQQIPQHQPTWRDTFAADLRENPNLTKFDSVEKLAEGYLNASKLVGKRASEIPVEQLKAMYSPEEMASFYKGMGVPEAPDKYQVTSIPDHIREIPQVKEGLAQAQNLAHKLGIPDSSFNEIVKMEFELHESQRLAQQQSNFSALSNIFGRDLGRADEVAAKAVLNLGGQPLLDKLVRSGMAHDPDVFQALYKLGSGSQQDRLPTGGHGAPQQGAAEINEQIQALYKDTNFYNQFKENNPAAREKMENLYQRLQQFEQRR